MRGLAVAVLVMVASASAVAQAPSAGIDPALCRYLPAHRPAPDVEYTPGVDVRGNPVAPADLPGSGGALPGLDRFEMPVTAAFARRMGFAVPQGLPLSTEFGRITIQGDRVLFNGQPVGPSARAELYAVCRTR
ncbi:hypothetical protein HL658_06630 [Azospirillum sp. RWY-5-1]|uniref:Uncharacterized protein n=1 Tax=Azospirillum oleiclasticum TaxID=2735135 RepID=A0ABX2T4X4_9PROT|nr:hypothetical protein [Azospirillum oleiclasticum]NYZ12219.1 hypothetical protein [Azospirillum oleiclasticum]NYZ19379.1 hypothetical protein [Azospirillum oleiclasticum]